ncbi:MAG TPA: valine--tRNA ligase [Candidatus Saccharimonadales bacterium]|jgi:valyl-tRNA synthetase|nr:valine--tRNA ligase [Candidatus Saccharimonadales bacterium]
MSHELPKSYDQGLIESRWAEYWVQEKLFSVRTPEPGSPEAGKPVFTLLLPPPNVTGRLHMGHMLNQTEMDIIMRWRRMRGFLTLWLPGTDHAGIATQMMVEKQLASEGLSRQKLGRESFVERVWEWKKLYGSAITGQMRTLGASVDWDREYFTMDAGLSRAVCEAFVRLHEQGLIYRGKYVVNWCPRCMTAISDLEVVHEDTVGKLYHIRYPVAGGSGDSVTIATTRPETMLGDVAVAVNPKDARYLHLHGKKLRLPLMERDIPVVTDDLADPEFGTGAVKVTPAHDPNDFQLGLRHHLPQINIMDDQARINENGGAYAGLDRYAAREKILKDLDELGLLAGIKDHAHALGRCDRCKTVVEPRLSVQWFIKIAPLAQRAIEAVEKGEIVFTPANYAKTYFEWMRNIHDWCISRQLWWGHRIPVWHCHECKEITVARSIPAGCSQCGSAQLEQDSDVLDTWFSSGLLPFTVMGWPEKTRAAEVFYPTSLLITGFDILFFWVARMIMLGCHFMAGHPQGSVPFREVYIHALVRDADRQKMSKTKGNVIDPIEVTKKYGTDAVRFTLASMASPGTDIAFSEGRTEGYRAFANKIWNAARFMFMNLDRVGEGASLTSGAPQKEMDLLENRWIMSRFHRAAGQVNQGLTDYRFDEAASTVYQFFWLEFCDWYLEIIKPRLLGPADDARSALAFLGEIFEGALRLLSPFMPFITEEIWHAMYDGRPPAKSIALAHFPEGAPQRLNDRAEEQMTSLQDLIEKIRNLRAEFKVLPKDKVPARIHAAADFRKLVEENRALVERLASVQGIEFVPESLANTPGARTTPSFEVCIVYEQKIDVGAERDRLTKEIKKLEGALGNAQRQLGNDSFLAKAPPQVVEGLRKQSAEMQLMIEKNQAALARLG